MPADRAVHPTASVNVLFLPLSKLRHKFALSEFAECKEQVSLSRCVLLGLACSDFLFLVGEGGQS